MLYKTISLITLCMWCLTATQTMVAQDIVISEILASNANTGIDERNNTPDWIELCNTSSSPISLRNWRISDKSNFTKAFVLPDTTLAPGKCLLVWASDYIDDVPHPTIIEGASGGIGHWRGSDSFHFLYLPVSGDFEISVRIHTLVGGTLPEAGLIVREENKPLSRYSGIMSQNDGRVFVHINPSTRPNEEKAWFSTGVLSGNTDFPYCWLRLRRTGDTLVMYNSLDNSYWFESSHYYFPFKTDQVFAGLAFSSGSDSIAAKTGFSGFRLNGREHAPKELKYIAYDCKKSASVTLSREIHAPFALSQTGEKIYLWNSEGTLKDTLSFGVQRRSVSFGLDGKGQRRWFAEPTPGRKNPSDGAADILPDPVSTINSGYYTTPFPMRISSPRDTTIIVRYTTDFTIPTAQSRVFTDSLRITKNTSVRLRAFRNGSVPSRTVTRTYIFEGPTAPGISTVFITANPAEFWSDSIGIWAKGKNADTVPPYWGANFWGDREAPVQVELNQGNSQIFAADMGAKNHGYGGRFNDQKPLDIQTSSPFGNGEIADDIFAEKNTTGIKKLLLRTGSQDWPYTMLRDPLAALLALRVGVDAQGYRPVRVYLNGEYWGIYQLREKSDESFIASNYDVNEDEVNLIGTLGHPLQGSSVDWNASVAMANESAMAVDSVFSSVAAPFDLKNFIRYWAFEIFAMNVDWPGNNLKAWRAGASHPQWRHIVQDNDLSFAAAWDTGFNMFDYVLSPVATHWANQPEATALFRNFMKNNRFRARFLSRLADFLNTEWSAAVTTKLLDSLAGQIAPEIPQHIARWPNSVKNWYDEIQRLRSFLESRPEILRKHTVATFGLPGITAVAVQNSEPDAGLFHVNSLTVHSDKFEGIYFRGIPLEVSVMPEEGYEFIGWKTSQTDSVFSTSSVVFVKPETDTLTLTAMYRRNSTQSTKNVVINEIMYKAPDSNDTKDWIELYNPSDAEYDVSGWTLKDEDNDHSFTLPDNTIIAPFGYLVIAEDSLEMRKRYTYSFPLSGQFDYGFGRGDMVRLYDKSGKTVDSVRYERFLPWPVEADGSGASLELRDAALDNTLPESWKASLTYVGTPGRQNSVFEPSSVAATALVPISASITPHPATDRAILHITLPEAVTFRVDILDYLGRVIMNRTFFGATTTTDIELPTASLGAGLYQCVITPFSAVKPYSTLFSVIH